MNSALPPSRISVPRPAMLVAIVTEPLRPACATNSASCAWYFAINTTCLSAPPPVEHRREFLGLFNRHRADQDGPAFRVLVENFGDDGVPLLLFGAVHQIGV